MSANLLYSTMQWGTLVALAKFGTPVMLGHFGLALAIATPATLLTGFGLRAMQATDVQRRYAFADYLHLRLLGNLGTVIIVAGTVVFTPMDPALVGVLVPIVCAKLVEATSETCYGLEQRNERIRLVAVSRVVRGALGLAGLTLAIAFGGSLATGAWIMAAAWAAFLIADVRNAHRIEPLRLRADPAAIARLASEGAPLCGVNAMLALSQSIPRYLLQIAHGTASVGYFTALAAIGPALEQFSGAIGHAASPRLGALAGADGRGYRRLVVRLFGVGAAMALALTLGAIVGGRPFLRLAYAPDYQVYRTAFVLVAASGGFLVINSLSYFAIVAARRPRLLLMLQCMGVLITATSGVLLIPRFAVSGAAGAVFLGRAAVCVVTMAVVLRAPGRRR